MLDGGRVRSYNSLSGQQQSAEQQSRAAAAEQQSSSQQSSSNDGSRACDLLLLLENFWWVIYKQLMHCIVHTLYAGELCSLSLFLMEKFSTVEMNSS